METGSEQRPKGTGRPSEGEDETLDIVRSMIEAETHEMGPHPQNPSRNDGGTSAAAQGQRAHEAGLETPQRPADPLEGQNAPSGEDRHARKQRNLSRSGGRPGRDRLGFRQGLKGKWAVRGARWAALAAAALLLILKPWLLPLMIFMMIWFSLILFLLLGSARLAELTQRVWTVYSARRPERAARVYKVLQRAADKADGLLARLPETWTDGIYTPDLGRSARGLSAERRAALEDDPFARLAAAKGRTGRKVSEATAGEKG